MNDDNWDTVSGPTAHSIEFLNYLNQTNTIRAIFTFLAHKGGITPNGCSSPPTDVHLKELHRAGTALLLHKPGEYRTTPISVVKPDGTPVYVAPKPENVEAHMRNFFGYLNKHWDTMTPVQAGAYALWRINWVHPFKNGNGRTARAFSYACICLKYGLLLPGQPTVIDQIMTVQQARDDYEKALQAADKATGGQALTLMEQLLEQLLKTQLSAVPPQTNPP